jgi:hypothetical protein
VERHRECELQSGEMECIVNIHYLSLLSIAAITQLDQKI